MAEIEQEKKKKKMKENVERVFKNGINCFINRSVLGYSWDILTMKMYQLMLQMSA